LIAVRRLLVPKDDPISPEELLHWAPKPWTEEDHRSLERRASCPLYFAQATPPQIPSNGAR
jgi:hypothetical protein